jgi:ketol-acid reductoisomerase
MKTIETNVIGKSFSTSNSTENTVLIAVNKSIRQHPIEETGTWLRASMTAMKKIG